LGQIAAHGILHRDAATHSGRERSAPSRLLGGEIEYTKHAWRFVEQGPAVFDRVLLGCRGQLVDEALDDKDIVRGSNAAPIARREAWRLVSNVLQEEVWQVIKRLGALNSVAVKPILEGWWYPPGKDR